MFCLGINTIQNMSQNRATRLASLRNETGMSMREVAEAVTKLGVSISHARIGAYEADKNAKIKMPVLRKLAQVYKTSVEFIESGKHPSPKQEDTFVFVNTENDEFIDLPFVDPPAYGSFLSGCHDRNFGRFDTVRIVKRPGVDYKDAVVIEVRGNSMAPRYPDRSCYVVRPVSDGNWQHALGVHAISLRSEMFLIKRLVSNVGGVIKLRSDSNGDEMEIQLGDINCMWKVGESSYMPPED